MECMYFPHLVDHRAQAHHIGTKPKGTPLCSGASQPGPLGELRYESSVVILLSGNLPSLCLLLVVVVVVFPFPVFESPYKYLFAAFVYPN